MRFFSQNQNKAFILFSINLYSFSNFLSRYSVPLFSSFFYSHLHRLDLFRVSDLTQPSFPPSCSRLSFTFAFSPVFFRFTSLCSFPTINSLAQSIRTIWSLLTEPRSSFFKPLFWQHWNENNRGQCQVLLFRIWSFRTWKLLKIYSSSRSFLYDIFKFTYKIHTYQTYLKN